MSPGDRPPLAVDTVAELGRSEVTVDRKVVETLTLSNIVLLLFDWARTHTVKSNRQRELLQKPWTTLAI